MERRRRCVLHSNYTKVWISKGSGTVGVITYLRTDSTRISDEADAAARGYIGSEFMERNMWLQEMQIKNDGKKIQDAHEAIRPTDISRTPAAMKELS